MAAAPVESDEGITIRFAFALNSVAEQACIWRLHQRLPKPHVRQPEGLTGRRAKCQNRIASCFEFYLQPGLFNALV
jgi:hypothetical protein